MTHTQVLPDRCPNCGTRLKKYDGHTDMMTIRCDLCHHVLTRAPVSSERYLISVPTTVPVEDKYVDGVAERFISPLSKNLGGMGIDFIISTVNAILNRWETFRVSVPCMRIDFEVAEYVLNESQCFHSIYEEITGIEVNRKYPSDDYLTTMEVASHMMVVMTPQFMGTHPYGLTMDKERLLTIYSDNSIKIPFSAAGIIWRVVHQDDRFPIKLYG